MLTPSTLQTILIYPDALLLVGVLIILLLLKTDSYGKPKDTLKNQDEGSGLQATRTILLRWVRPMNATITLVLQLLQTVLQSSLHQSKVYNFNIDIMVKL